MASVKKHWQDDQSNIAAMTSKSNKHKVITDLPNPDVLLKQSSTHHEAGTLTIVTGCKR